MRVLIKHGTVKYNHVRYNKGDTLDVSPLFFQLHEQRFMEINEKPTSTEKKHKAKRKAKADAKRDIVSVPEPTEADSGD